jgi:hypothetical protein
VWANTVAAYATLPPLLRGLADQLRALHSNGYDYAHPNATARQVRYRETVFRFCANNALYLHSAGGPASPASASAPDIARRYRHTSR